MQVSDSTLSIPVSSHRWWFTQSNSKSTSQAPIASPSGFTQQQSEKSVQDNTRRKQILQQMQRQKHKQDRSSQALLNSSFTQQTQMNKGHDSKQLVEEIQVERRINAIPSYAEGQGIWSPPKIKNPTKKDFMLLMKTMNQRYHQSPPQRKRGSTIHNRAEYDQYTNSIRAGQETGNFEPSQKNDRVSPIAKTSSSMIMRYATRNYDGYAKPAPRSRSSNLSITFNLPAKNGDKECSIDRNDSQSPRRNFFWKQKSQEPETLGEQQIAPTPDSPNLSQTSFKVNSKLDKKQPKRHVSRRGLQARYSSGAPETNTSINLLDNHKKDDLTLHESEKSRRSGVTKGGRNLESRKSVGDIDDEVVISHPKEEPREMAPKSGANLFQFQSQSQLSVAVMQELQKKTLGEQDGETSEGVTQSSILVGETSPIRNKLDQHERKYLKRLEQEELAMSMAIERREKNILQMNHLNEANRSLEVQQLRLLKDFSKQIKVNKKLRKVAKTARAQATVTSLPPIVRDRLTLDGQKSNLKDMLNGVLLKQSGKKPNRQAISPTRLSTTSLVDPKVLQSLGIYDLPGVKIPETASGRHSSLMNAKSKTVRRRNHTIINTNFMRLEETDDSGENTITSSSPDFKMPKRVRNSQEWKSGPSTSRNQGSNLKKSVHLKIMQMQRTHNSIIPEEYEPYSTGRWSMTNPHSSTIQTSTSFKKIKQEIAKEFNMYQKVEQQRTSAMKAIEEKRKRALNPIRSSSTTLEHEAVSVTLPLVVQSPQNRKMADCQGKISAAQAASDKTQVLHIWN